jgi:hypothetical protein
MRRALLLATFVAPLVAFACASQPAAKMCSAEAPPKHEKGPVSIGMCTNDGPPASLDAGTSDAMPGDAPEPTPATDAGASSAVVP